MWIGSGLGAPRKFFADNWNEEYWDTCENLNIEMMRTAAGSPWANGLCEQTHCVTDRCSLEKILEDDPEMPLNIALAWGINAKNSLQMWNGFSSYQLVFC